MTAALLLLLSSLSQDPRALAEKLQSDSVEEREAAYRRLKEIGPAALGEIERVAKAGDAEGARLAKRLIAAIATLGKLTPNLRKDVPGFEELAADRAAAWSEALVEAVQSPEKHPRLAHRDLEVLAVEAVRSEHDLVGVCQAIVRRQLRGAIPAISAYLTCDAGFVRAGVARTLGELNARDRVGSILPLLDDGDVEVRLAALEALRSLRARDASPSVTPLLHRKETARKAASVLASLGAKESIAPLVRMLDDGEGDLAFALDALSGSRLEDAKSALVGALGGGDARKRERVARALLDMDAVDPLLPLLEDKDPELRASVALWLGRRGRREAIPFLRKQAGTEFGLESAELLYGMGEKDALEFILKHLRGDAGVHRLAALQAVVDLGAKESVREVVPSLRDPAPAVRLFAITALETLGGKDVIPELRRSLEDGDPQNRVQAMAVLAALGDGEVVPLATDLLRKGGPGTGHAVASLARLNVREAIPAIAKVLSSEDRSSRAYACLALGDLRAGERAADLVRCLCDEERWVGRCAASALEKIGPKDALPPLLALLEKGTPRERRIALECLPRLGGPGAVAPLARLLGDEATPVRVLAAMGLCVLGRDLGVPTLLEERAGLIYLNALRDPEAWGNVRRHSKPREGAITGRGEVRDDVLRWAQVYGLPLRWEPGSRGELSIWKNTLGFPAPPRLDLDDPTDGLCALLDDGRFAAIVEKGEVRVVTYDEAWAFWAGWWGERKK